MGLAQRGQPMIVVSTRPNIIKAAPIIAELNRRNIQFTLVHTGQHYDAEMSDSVMADLGVDKPDFRLNISGSCQRQAHLFQRDLIPILKELESTYVMVFGDVNGAFFSAKMAAELKIPIAHVEAGLRSFDKTMPEELNRVAIDQISEWLFVTEPSGMENLKTEGIDRQKCFLVGNVMIDALKSIPVDGANDGSPYAVWTIHRPSNVDDQKQLERWLELLEWTSKNIRVKWFMHPRTLSNFGRYSDWKSWKNRLQKRNVEINRPSPYGQFHQVLRHAKFVVTDSGGLQEEAFYLRTPCLTLRNNTERPITLNHGANVLIEDLNKDKFIREVHRVLHMDPLSYPAPELWDGKAASRIIDILHPN